MPKDYIFISTNNALQNLGGSPVDRVTERGNLSVQSPTIGQLNAALSSGTVHEDEPVERAFGENVRQAAGVVRRVLGS